MQVFREDFVGWVRSASIVTHQCFDDEAMVIPGQVRPGGLRRDEAAPNPPYKIGRGDLSQSRLI